MSKHKYLGRNRSSGNVTCDSGDYLALLENVNGKIFEISRFCGNGRVPRIYSRGRNVILEFFARKDGTVTHDGFQVTLQEEEEERVSQVTRHANCAFVYRSSVRNSRETIKSPRSWFPPNTVCTYKFLGRNAERVSIYIKILRNEFGRGKPEVKRNFSLNYCPGNEISVYNGARVIDLSNCITLRLVLSYQCINFTNSVNIHSPIFHVRIICYFQYKLKQCSLISFD